MEVRTKKFFPKNAWSYNQPSFAITSETKNDIKHIFELSIPVIIENVLQTLLGVSDTFFAGKISDTAIAGIGLTNQVMNVLIAVFTAISVGSIAIISRNYGRKDFKNVNKAIVHSIVLGTILGLASGIICFVLRSPILLASGANAETLPYAMPYYVSVTSASVFLCLNFILSSCLRAVKDTKTPMYITGATSLIKILITIVFMKIGLGILGLGIATTLSRAIGMIILFSFLKFHHKEIKLSFCKLSKDTFSPILKIGIPASAEKLIMKLGQVIFFSMVVNLGTSAYVSHNVASGIDNLTWSCAMGFGLAACATIGVSLGEDDVKKAKKQTELTTYISMAVLSVIGVILFIFAPQLAAIFTDTKEIQDSVVSILRLLAFVQPFSALQQVMTSALQGAGDTKYPMFSTLIGIWVIRDAIGFFLAMHLGLGLMGCWYALALDIVFRGILLLIRFQKGKWQHIKI
ncbi:MAG: MATE family efflux transporter [Firmicutes bacterium]|nr:MATE family efflux transporter [Bacillota bacterium]